MSNEGHDASLFGAFAFLRSFVGLNAHSECVELDESRSVSLIVRAAVVVKGGDRLVEQRIGLRLARDHNHSTFVELELDRTIDTRLRLVDERLQQHALG